MMKQLHFLIAPLILLCTTIHITATDHSTFHEKEPVNTFSLEKDIISAAMLGISSGLLGGIIGSHLIDRTEFDYPLSLSLKLLIIDSPLFFTSRSVGKYAVGFSPVGFIVHVIAHSMSLGASFLGGLIR